jgi:hypothetical protein
MRFKYDTPEKVTRKEFNILSQNFKGLFAWQKKEGEFYIKLWFPKYRQIILQAIK